MTMMVTIPPGYYFVPTDEELITSYLLKKSMGLPLPWNQISEKDIYGENPWDVLNDVHWDDHFSADKKKIKKETYVFTRLKSRITGKTRIGRRTRSGTWKGQTTGKDIMNGSNLIGVSKSFTFQETNCKKGEEHDRWTMNEYSLAGTCLKNFELKYEDYVICKISWTISSKEKENQPPPIIIPQLQRNPILDEDDQSFADELEQALCEENQSPIIPDEQCRPISDDQLLGYSNNNCIGKKRSGEEIFESSRKMQKTSTDLDDMIALIDFDIDDISSLMQLGEMTSCSSSNLDASFC